MNYFMKTNHRHLAVPHTMLGIEGLLVSIPAKNGLWTVQEFTASRVFKGEGGRFDICIRYDLGDPHNTQNAFAMIGDFDGVTGPLTFHGTRFNLRQCEKYWPELAHLEKWHLCSDGVPWHYIANTLYHAREGNFALARQTAAWDDAPEEILAGESCYLEVALRERLPALQEQFRTDLAATGMKLTP